MTVWLYLLLSTLLESLGETLALRSKAWILGPYRQVLSADQTKVLQRLLKDGSCGLESDIRSVPGHRQGFQSYRCATPKRPPGKGLHCSRLAWEGFVPRGSRRDRIQGSGVFTPKILVAPLVECKNLSRRIGGLEMQNSS